jgi:hypothetical protein
MKNLGLYGAGLLAARNINGGGSGGGGGSGSGVGTTWTRRTRTSQGNWLFGVAYGDGLFVAVGEDGIILTSPDGVDWTAQTSGTGNDLNGVAYGDGLFVVVGDRSIILTSP